MKKVLLIWLIVVVVGTDSLLTSPEICWATSNNYACNQWVEGDSRDWTATEFPRSLPTPTDKYAVEFTPKSQNSIMHAIDGDGMLSVLDSFNPNAETVLGDLSFPKDYTASSMMEDPLTGLLYCFALKSKGLTYTSGFFQVFVGTVSLSTIREQDGAWCISAAIDGSGVMYMLDVMSQFIWRDYPPFDATNPVALGHIGPGLAANYGQDMTVNFNDDIIVAFYGTIASVETGRLSLLNKMTGALTPYPNNGNMPQELCSFACYCNTSNCQPLPTTSSTTSLSSSTTSIAATSSTSTISTTSTSTATTSTSSSSSSSFTTITTTTTATTTSTTSTSTTSTETSTTTTTSSSTWTSTTSSTSSSTFTSTTTFTTTTTTSTSTTSTKTSTTTTLTTTITTTTSTSTISTLTSTTTSSSTSTITSTSTTSTTSTTTTSTTTTSTSTTTLTSQTTTSTASSTTSSITTSSSTSTSSLSSTTSLTTSTTSITTTTTTFSSTTTTSTSSTSSTTSSTSVTTTSTTITTTTTTSNTLSTTSFTSTSSSTTSSTTSTSSSTSSSSTTTTSTTTSAISTTSTTSTTTTTTTSKSTSSSTSTTTTSYTTATSSTSSISWTSTASTSSTSSTTTSTSSTTSTTSTTSTSSTTASSTTSTTSTSSTTYTTSTSSTTYTTSSSTTSTSSTSTSSTSSHSTSLSTSPPPSHLSTWSTTENPQTYTSTSIQEFDNSEETSSSSIEIFILLFVLCVGALCLIGGVGAFVLWFRKRSGEGFQEHDEEMEDELTNYVPIVSTLTTPTDTPNASIGRSSGHKTVLSRATSSMNLQTWEIAYNSLNMEEELGRGAFGVVYRAFWRGAEVAVKVLIADLDVDQMEEFEAEAALMKALRPHTNIVQFQGVSTGERLCIVSEFCEKGALYTLLHDENAPITPVRKFKFVRGTASGMLHLTLEGIIHRDLAARNVLLSAGWVPKITDFGMSRILIAEDEGSAHTTKEVGPLKWMAPESLRNKTYSEKTDVWSFGVTLFEILTREEPYPDLNPVQVATMMGAGSANLLGYLEEEDEHNESLVNLMKDCMNWDPNERPDFEKINIILNARESSSMGLGGSS